MAQNYKKKMNNPNFRMQFAKNNSQYCESVSSKPDESFVPGQAIKLSELVARFQRGQRLNVHMTGSNFVSPDTPDETFENAAPENIQDIVDIDAYNESIKRQKSEFHERQKSKKQKEKEDDDAAHKAKEKDDAE